MHKKLISLFPYAFGYRKINFFTHMFMHLCKFVWIGPKCAFNTKRYYPKSNENVPKYRYR